MEQAVLPVGAAVTFRGPFNVPSWAAGSSETLAGSVPALPT
jgi:hypothetical protein